MHICQFRENGQMNYTECGVRCRPDTVRLIRNQLNVICSSRLGDQPENFLA
jgi:hypothetical protein